MRRDRWLPWIAAAAAYAPGAGLAYLLAVTADDEPSSAHVIDQLTDDLVRAEVPAEIAVDAAA
jgi:hypothetical protein